MSCHLQITFTLYSTMALGFWLIILTLLRSVIVKADYLGRICSAPGQDATCPFESPGWHGDMSVPLCIDHCTNSSYAYAILDRPDSCYCMNDIPSGPNCVFCNGTSADSEGCGSCKLEDHPGIPCAADGSMIWYIFRTTPLI